MKVRLEGEVEYVSEKEWEGKEGEGSTISYKHSVRDGASNSLVSFYLDSPLLIGTTVVAEGSLKISNWQGKIYMSVGNPKVKLRKYIDEDIVVENEE